MEKVFYEYEYDGIVRTDLTAQREAKIASDFRADVILTIPGRFDKRITELPHDASCREGMDYIETAEYSMAEELDESFLYRRVYQFDDEEAARYHFVNSQTHEPLFRDAANSTNSAGNAASMKLPKPDADTLRKAMKDESKSPAFEVCRGKDNLPYLTIKQMTRTCYGKVKLIFLPDQTMPRKNEITFCDAFVMLFRHDFTRFGVMELYIPECTDTLHILEAYRHGRMRIVDADRFDPVFFGAKENARSVVYEEEPFEQILKKTNGFSVEGTCPDIYTEEAFFNQKDLLFRCYGMKRSAVFAYNEAGEAGISDREALHVLANEETPKDGGIGESFSDLLKNNRSQYEGHRTYASTATLLEIQTLDPEQSSLRDRMDYQTSETFFVEMILLRDAATDEIKKDILRMESQIADSLINSKTATKNLEKINKHMSLALQFDGTSYYKWPTVQRSVELLTSDLGVRSIAEKYKENEALLTSMIKSLSSKESKKLSESQKRYVMILALTSPLNSIANVYKNVFYNLLRPVFSETVTQYSIFLIDMLPLIISVIVVIAFFRNEKKKSQL